MQTSAIIATHDGRAMYDLSLPGTRPLESEYVDDRYEHEVAQATYNAWCRWTNLNNGYRGNMSI
jgi:hypothetical protein